MVMTRYVLDAWALLAFLQKEEPAAARMRELLIQAKTLPEMELYASAVNLGEVYYRIAKKRSQSDADQTLSLIKRLSVRTISATDERVYAAARFKGQYAVSYADAFACTASQEVEGILVTGDPEMIRLSTILKLEILTRNHPNSTGKT